MMHFRRILLILMVMIFMTSTLSVKAATTASLIPPLAPWDTEVVDKITGGYVGSHVSIAHYEQNGRAYISYYDSFNGDLKLAYQVNPGTGDCPGNANWKCMTVDDSGNDVGKFSSIDVVAAPLASTASIQSELTVLGPTYAKIGISYYDDTNKALKFALRTCVATSLFPICSWHITTVDDSEFIIGDNLGQYSSFKFGTAAQPVIYYHGYHTIPTTVGMIKRAFLPTGNDFSGYCDAGWTCEVVAASTLTPDYGIYISADGGRVVFYDDFEKQLITARSTGSSMSSSCGVPGNYWDCKAIDNTTGVVGEFASMVYDSVHPMQVAYYDRTNGKIKYAIERTSGGGTTCVNGNFDCFAVDTIGIASIQSHIGISLTIDEKGKPVVAYQDFSEDQAPAALKLARPSSAYGQLIGNCGDVPPGYTFLYWQCGLLDGGGSFLNEADYAAVTVSPVGLATVAYYEDDGYNYEGHLKVAQQHFVTFLPIISK